MKLTDKSIIAFGIHKGKALEQLPALWFLWLYDQPTFDKTGMLADYIRDNMQVLKQQAKDEARNDKFLRR